MMRWLFNFWPPFRAAGIKVMHIADDWSAARVELRMKLLNRNYVGTHFGGSLFAMTDPFFMILMIHRLGSDYIVWDKAASIRFRRPGRGTVRAEFRLTPDEIAEVKQLADATGRTEPVFSVDVVDRDGNVVATVEKTLSVRKREQTDHAKL